VVPDRLYPWLILISGLLVVGVGAAVLSTRLRHRLAHARGHDHHHHHHHHGGAGESLGWRSLVGVGVSGGLLPCPSALVVLLAAISLHRVAFGLLLIVAFSVGLAAVLIAIGLLIVYARQLVARFRGDGIFVTRWLPLTSAAVVTLLGLAIALQAVRTGLPGLSL
jgi:ABC-type nickel/cobalt efflux system permease component RcnA